MALFVRFQVKSMIKSTGPEGFKKDSNAHKADITVKYPPTFEIPSSLVGFHKTLRGGTCVLWGPGT